MYPWHFRTEILLNVHGLEGRDKEKHSYDFTSKTHPIRHTVISYIEELDAADKQIFSSKCVKSNTFYCRIQHFIII